MKTSIAILKKSFQTPEFKISWLHVVVLVLCFLWFKSCNEAKQFKNEIAQNTIAINDTIKYYTNKQGEEVASKLALKGSVTSLEMLLSTSRDSTKQLEKLTKYYKRVAAAVRTETVTEIDSIKVPYIVEGLDFSIPFNLQKKYYSLTGKSTNKGLFIDRLSIPNSQSIVIGDKKNGFFKTEYRIDVVNSNPFVKTTSVDGYNYTEQKKRFGIGLYGGYGLDASGLGPQIGIGVNYSIIKF